MRLLVASTNPRAGKTSIICGLSKIKKFRYEKLGEIRGAELILSDLSEKSDLTVIEGGETYKHGIASGKGDYHAKFDRVLLIATYSKVCFDELWVARRVFGDKFAAAIVNEIPENEVEKVRNMDLDFEVIGTIPYERSLSGTKASSIAKLLNGEILTSPSDEVMIGKLLIGAMSPSCAVKWLEKAEDSALITGGDRVDLQKLALDSGVKCLILTGGFEPPKVIVKKAEEVGAVIILSKHDTLTSLEKIQNEIGKEVLDEARMERAAEIVREHVDFNRLFEILGI